jgi:hypothetical protein
VAFRSSPRRVRPCGTLRGRGRLRNRIRAAKADFEKTQGKGRLDSKEPRSGQPEVEVRPTGNCASRMYGSPWLNGGMDGPSTQKPTANRRAPASCLISRPPSAKPATPPASWPSRTLSLSAVRLPQHTQIPPGQAIRTRRARNTPASAPAGTRHADAREDNAGDTAPELANSVPPGRTELAVDKERRVGRSETRRHEHGVTLRHCPWIQRSAHSRRFARPLASRRS